jgi:Methyltransferase small domain
MQSGLTSQPGSDDVARWLEALEARHLANFTAKEVARALRALSSCYVERRARLTKAGALDSAGKRAAFALFYAPMHFLVTREILRALPGSCDLVQEIQDVGCGTGAVGVAWAVESGAASIRGNDSNPWAVEEANWTYRVLGLSGRATVRDIGRSGLAAREGTATILAYVVNELADPSRAKLLEQILAGGRDRGRVLVIEPIARRAMPWWPAWESAFRSAGGRADEWRFPCSLPPRQLALARAAGLDPRELTARSLYLPSGRD